MPGHELDEVLLRFRKLPKPVRVIYARPRTFIAIVETGISRPFTNSAHLSVMP